MNFLPTLYPSKIGRPIGPFFQKIRSQGNPEPSAITRTVIQNKKIRLNR